MTCGGPCRTSGSSHAGFRWPARCGACLSTARRTGHCLFTPQARKRRPQNWANVSCLCAFSCGIDSAGQRSARSLRAVDWMAVAPLLRREIGLSPGLPHVCRGWDCGLTWYCAVQCAGGLTPKCMEPIGWSSGEPCEIGGISPPRIKAARRNKDSAEPGGPNER